MNQKRYYIRLSLCHQERQKKTKKQNPKHYKTGLQGNHISTKRTEGTSGDWNPACTLLTILAYYTCLGDFSNLHKGTKYITELVRK